MLTCTRSHLSTSRTGNRGASYVSLYPKHELAHLCFCAKCGARFVKAGTNGMYLGCGGRVARRCDVRTLARRDLLRSLLIEQIRAYLLEAEKRVDDLLQAVREDVRNAVPKVESELVARQHEYRRTQCAISNLLEFVEVGKGDSGNLRSLSQRLAELERRATELSTEIKELEQRRIEPTELPSREWLVAQILSLQDWLANDPADLAAVFRAFTGGRVEMKEITPPGKKHGHFEARFRGNVLAVVAGRVRDSGATKSCEWARLLQQVCRNRTFLETTVLDVRRLSRAERLADAVRQSRERGVLWKDIRRLFRCGYQTAKAALSLSVVAAE